MKGGDEAIWAICRYQQIPNKSPKNEVLATKIGMDEFLGEKSDGEVKFFTFSKLRDIIRDN